MNARAGRQRYVRAFTTGSQRGNPASPAARYGAAPKPLPAEYCFVDSETAPREPFPKYAVTDALYVYPNGLVGSVVGETITGGDSDLPGSHSLRRATLPHAGWRTGRTGGLDSWSREAGRRTDRDERDRETSRGAAGSQADATQPRNRSGHTYRGGEVDTVIN